VCQVGPKYFGGRVSVRIEIFNCRCVSLDRNILEMVCH